MTEIQLDKRFLTPKLLNIILFSKKNIVITNYCEPEKFDALFSILYPFSIEKIDLSTISDENMLNNYLADDIDLYSGKELKKFHVFTNAKSEQISQILQQEHLKFMLIGNHKIADSDPIKKSENLTFYSTKTGIFEPAIDSSTDLTWEEKVLTKLRKMESIEEGIAAANKIIRLTFTKARDIYLSYVKNGNNETTINKILKALGKKKPKIKDQMLSNLTRLTNSYYLVNIEVSEDGLNKILPKTEPEIEPKTESKIEKISPEQIGSIIEEEEENLNSNNMNDEQLEEYYDSAFETESSDIAEQEKNSPTDIALFKEEFSKISKSDRRLLKSFNQILNDFRIELKDDLGNEDITTPEQLYIKIRTDIWPVEIPANFSGKWFYVHMTKIMKNKKNGNEFDTVFSDQADKFSELIEDLPFGSPDFPELKKQLIELLGIKIKKEKTEESDPPPISENKDILPQESIKEIPKKKDIENDLTELDDAENDLIDVELETALTEKEDENELDELEIEENPETYHEIDTESDLEKVKTSISVLKKVVRKKIIENPQELDNALNHVLSFLIEP